MRSNILLTVDAAINLVLGGLLVIFPQKLVSVLGIPNSDSAFYPSILGAILCGIGIALLIERYRGSVGWGWQVPSASTCVSAECWQSGCYSVALNCLCAVLPSSGFWFLS